MICKRHSDNKYFNYTFINDAVVKVENPHSVDDTTFVNYPDWCKEYVVIDKWSSLT